MDTTDESRSAELHPIGRTAAEFARRRILEVSLLLGLLTLATYWPVLRSNFVNYDDPNYVTENARVATGLTWDNIKWAFGTGHASNWHPLTWLSHMLDVQLFGLVPGWHHLTSLLFHLANTVLLFGLLQRITGAVWRSAMVAALFAVHPLHVESVAWVAERKDVLSGFFFMLTLWAYVRYMEELGEKSEIRNPKSETNLKAEVIRKLETTQSVKVDNLGFGSPALEELLLKGKPKRAECGVQHTRLYYVLALVLFALGLMSKPMLVTLPLVLLLLDFWPLQRFQRAPLRSPVMADSHPPPPAATEVQRSKINDRGSIVSGVPKRMLSLLLEKAPFIALSAVSCLVTFLVQSHGGAVRTLSALSLGHRTGNAIMAYLDYLGQTIWPEGLAVFYPMPEHLAAGQVALAAAVLMCITAASVFGAAFPSAAGIRISGVRGVGWFWFVGMLVPVIGLIQVGMQQRADRYTYLPLIGIFLMVVWTVADQLRGRMVKAWLGGAVLVACAVASYAQVGHWQDSEQLFRHALQVTHQNYIAHNNLGYALFIQGKVDEAIVQYELALQINPDYDDAHNNLGRALAAQGKYSVAGAHFDAVLKLRPDDFKAHNNLGNVLAVQGRHAEAIQQFREALRVKPDHAAAHNNLAISYKELGRTADAIAEYREALRWQPNSLEAINNLAWILATNPDAQYRNGPEAVALATRACERTRYQQPIPMTTLSAAYAEAGRFPEAIALAQRAQQLTGGGPSALATQLTAMIASFGSGRAYLAK